MGKQKVESEPFAGLVQPGQVVRIFLKSGRGYQGKVLQIKDGWLVFEDTIGQVSILDINAVMMLTEGLEPGTTVEGEEAKARI